MPKQLKTQLRQTLKIQEEKKKTFLQEKPKLKALWISFFIWFPTRAIINTPKVQKSVLFCFFFNKTLKTQLFFGGGLMFETLYIAKTCQFLRQKKLKTLMKNQNSFNPTQMMKARRSWERVVYLCLCWEKKSLGKKRRRKGCMWEFL